MTLMRAFVWSTRKRIAPLSACVGRRRSGDSDLTKEVSAEDSLFARASQAGRARARQRDGQGLEFPLLGPTFV